MAILKDLIVHGSSRFLNKIYASEIQTPLIEAEAGVFKKLKADDATIVGLLDVQGQMHTNSWTNSNIATIDGSFYITPTLSSSSGTVSFSSATAATFTGTYSAVSSLYVGNNTASTVQWTSGSKILITGEVQVNGEWTPLGTLLGTLNSTNPTTSMPIVSITDNRNNSSTILADIYSLKGNTSLNYRNLKISLYQRADSSKYYPLGIFMTALGQNGKTFLDIYGGVNELKTDYGGYANPNVRIGNLSGLPAITTAAGNFTPVGWGIYTTNGYFSGTIVSNTGVIGGWKLGASSLYNGTTGLNNTTAGIYLGTDGIRNYKDANTYVNITEGVITAKGVNLTGEITATSGTIAGWTIKQSYLITGDNTSPGANILMLNGNGTTGSYTIAGTASTGWMITAGTTFGINKNGGVYATSGKIGGFEIGTTYIKNGKTSYNETTNDGVYLGTDGIGLGKGNFYVTNAGSLTAKSGSIGGWQLDANSFHIGTWGNDNSALICTGSGNSKSIGGSESINNWVFTAGANFGVTKSGALYANSANISGAITATSGSISGSIVTSGINAGNITVGTLSADRIGANSIDASKINVSSISIGNLNGASNYAQKTDVTQAIDNIEIGGRNLLKYNVKNYGIAAFKIATLSNCRGMYFACEGNQTYTISRKQVEGNRFWIATTTEEPVDGITCDIIFDEDNSILKHTFTTSSTAKYVFIYLSNESDIINNGNIKAEKGNKATDWTPAPEDVDETINNIEIGGRNLIHNSANFNKWYVQNGGAEGEIWHRSVSGNTSNVNLRPRTWIGTGYLADYYNKTITVSFEIMSPDWSAINEGSSYTGLKGLVIQLETAKGTPYSIIEETGRYFFSRLGNSNFKIDSALVDGQWVKVTSIPFKIDDSFWTYDTAKVDGYDNFTFSFILRRNGEISLRKLKIELGNKATDFTLAPEDTQENINNVSTVANTALGQSSWYATCSTSGGTTAKVATITPATTAFTLTPGATVNVKFDAKNTGAVGSITLNVNGTGAKNIKYINNNAISNIPGTDYIAAERTYQFVYDGTYWVIQNLNYNTNTNTIGTLGATKLIAGTNASNASATTVYRYTLIMKKTTGSNPTWVSLVTSSSNGTSKTRYTGGLYPDEIFYMSSNVSSSPYGYNSGASTGDSYAALGFDLRYSTNCGSTLVIGKPVYLVGEINSLDGLFYLDSTWWTQTEPTTEDGKIYIYLGKAYSTTNVYLVEKNPLMRYYRGAFRTEEQIAGMTATSYITYVDAANGIKIHNYNNIADYIQINSDAISMYRRDTQQPQVPIETLRIQSDNIRIGKIGTGKRNVFITDNDVQIRNNTTVLASYGDSIQIGQISYPHIALDTTTFSAYNNETDIYFTLGNGATEGQLNYIVGDYKYNCTLSYGIDSITSIKINGTSLAGDKYSFQVGAKTLIIYEKVIQGDSIVISYNYSTINTETGGQTITPTSQTLSVASQSISFSTGNESITITSVTINDVATNNYTYSNNNITFTDSYMPNTGDEVIVNYITANVSPYFIFGNRLTNSQYGSGSVTFGKNLSVSGLRSFAIGDSNKISGQDSFSCGVNNQISGYAAGALGSSNKVFNTCGFTIGVNNTVNSKYSLAAGNYSVANAESSIALGVAVKTSEISSLACGHYNIPNGNLFSIGCGTSSSLQNAFAIDTSGNAYLKGNLSALVSGKTPIPMFKTKTYSWTLSVSANTAANPVMQNIRITNYTPISVLGMYLQNNSGNAAAWRGCHVQNWWINPYGHNFYYRVVNNNSNNATLLMNVIVLYIASSAVSNSKLTIINN